MRGRAAAVVGAVASLALIGGWAAFAGAQTPADANSPAAAGPAEEGEAQEPMLDSSITAAEDESLSETDEATALEALATVSQP